MSFLLRALLVIAAIAYFSPHRGDSEKEAARVVAAAEASAKALTPADALKVLPHAHRDRLASEAGAALAEAATGSLRGAIEGAPAGR